MVKIINLYTSYFNISKNNQKLYFKIVLELKFRLIKT